MTALPSFETHGALPPDLMSISSSPIVRAEYGRTSQGALFVRHAAAAVVDAVLRFTPRRDWATLSEPAEGCRHAGDRGARRLV